MSKIIGWIKENPLEAGCYALLIACDVVIFCVTRIHGR
jgi:hypothetical protein